MATTSERIKEIMDEFHLTQADLVRRCEKYSELYGEKFGRSYISQYLSGKYVPNQRKLTILALALNVSETWLMGLDVPRDRVAVPGLRSEAMSLFDRLSEEQQKFIVSSMKGLLNE